MRDILYRIKDLTNEWIYGLPTKITKYFTSFQTIEGGYVAITKTETMGQFTGLTDSFGKKIFEGDLLCDDCVDEDGTTIHYCPKQVIYCSKTGCFGIDSSFYQDNSEIEPIPFYFGNDPIEVVGNIHDQTLI